MFRIILPATMVLLSLSCSSRPEAAEATAGIWKGVPEEAAPRRTAYYGDFELRRFSNETWFHYHRGEPVGRYRETARSNTSIELVHDQPNQLWWIRLFDDRCEVRHPRTNFQKWIGGSWQQKPTRAAATDNSSEIDPQQLVLTLRHQTQGHYRFEMENLDSDLTYKIWLDDRQIDGVDVRDLGEGNGELLVPPKQLDPSFAPDHSVRRSLTFQGYSGGTVAFSSSFVLELLPKYPVRYELIEHYSHREEQSLTGPRTFVQAGRHDSTGHFRPNRATLSITAPEGYTIIRGSVQLQKFSPGGRKIQLLGEPKFSDDKRGAWCQVLNPSAAGRHLALAAKVLGPTLLRHRSHRFHVSDAPEGQLPVGAAGVLEIPFHENSTFSLKCVFHDGREVVLMNGETKKAGVQVSTSRLRKRLRLELSWPDEPARPVRQDDANDAGLVRRGR